MKRLLSLAAAALLAATAGIAQVPVFIVAGQSNADGREYTQNLPHYLRGYRFAHLRWANVTSATARNSSHYEWDKRFAFCDVFDYWAEQQLQSKFYTLKCAYGGTAIAPGVTAEKQPVWYADAHWLHNNRAYRGDIARGKSLAKALTEGFADLKAAELDTLPEGYDVRAIFWHQGESDRAAADDYYLNLKTLIRHLRHSLALICQRPQYERLPFIMGTVCRRSKQYNPRVEAAQRRLAHELQAVYLVDMADASLLPDQLHFDAAATDTLGRQIFEKCRQLGLFARRAPNAD